jgi:hypothetical protein
MRQERPAGRRATSERKADLAACRPGQELTKRYEIGIAGLVDPSAAHHQLIPEVAEMRDRTAERGEAEF